MKRSNICKNCGKIFFGYHKFCSKLCYSLWQKGKNMEQILGKEKVEIFRQKMRRSMEKKFGEKRAEEIKNKIRQTKKDRNQGAKSIYLHYPKKCKYCNFYFTEKKGSISQQFCSHKCYTNWKTGRTYEEMYGFQKSVEIHYKKAGTNPESKKHIELKEYVSNFLESKGYEVFTEVSVWLGFYYRIADVVGIKGQEKVAVECGSIEKKKFKEYSDVFQWIIHIPYSGKIKYLKGVF